MGPEIGELRGVVVNHVAGIADLRKTVDQKAVETQLRHTPFQFARGGFRVLHRQCGEAAETRRVPLDLLGEYVVGLAGDEDRLLRVGNGLHRRRIQREDREGRAPLVHLFKALLLEVEQVRFQIHPHLGAGVDLRVFDRQIDGEMLFQRNLVFHDGKPVVRKPRYGAPRRADRHPVEI
jgi:hypothetical protein